MRKEFYGILPLALTSCLASQATAQEKQTQRPNVVFIYADDIGYGDLSCNGAKTIHTPNVERLAKMGVRFTNAHSAAATSTPSRYAMLTGEYAWRKAGTGIAAGDAAAIIRPERYTMANLFKDAGYNTGVVGKWHLGLGDKGGEQDWNKPLQPKAVMAIMGDDVRWVGNEKGLGRETEWSATVLTPGIYARSEENNKRLGVFSKAEDLGSRAMLEKATELFWYPSEVDVSIRPGWFYHAEEDSKVKSLKHLADIYFQSVGYNSVLLLNIPPDRRGLINEADVQRLNEFAAYREKIFTNNRVEKGRKDWEAVSGSETVYSLKPESEINVVMLQEDITKGQRVESFTVEALTEQGWQEVAKGTTVGYKRMVRFPAVKATQLRVKINECRLTAHISQVAAYYADPLEEENRTENWNNLPRASWKQVAASPLTIDLGKEVELSAFTYAPLKAEAKPTMAFRYKFYVSADGKNWKEVPANGEFSNIMHNPLPQTVTFDQKEKARFIKLEATTPTATTAQVEMNEIGVTVAP